MVKATSISDWLLETKINASAIMTPGPDAEKRRIQLNPTDGHAYHWENAAFTFLIKTQVAVKNLKHSSVTSFIGTHLVLARTALLYRGVSLVSRV